METYIKDLNLSQETKTFLSWNMKITKLSELEGLNYLTFANMCPPNCNALAIADELNASGYLYPPENEISVSDIAMSKRLQNVLMRNNILYLSQLSMRPREEILKFRNLGEGTMPELDSICEKYGIQIRSLVSVKEAFSKCHFPAMLHTLFFQNDIFSIDDFRHKSTNDLYNICGHNFALTMKTYYTLKKNGVMFEAWEDQYLFEVLPKKKASLIWENYKITTLSQFADCNGVQHEELTSMFPELSKL
ncbi:MAG: hypothetical protein NC347_15390 [Clostridium sp.]|nr:hypothetical protein [Clostridium sp.]